MSLADELRKSVVNGASLAAKAIGSGAKQFNEWATGSPNAAANNEFDEFIEKAATSALKAGNDGSHDPQAGQPKALHFDPFDVVGAMGYRERPSVLTYAAMERIGRSVPVIADIINVRTNQVLMYCEPPKQRLGAGFQIQPKDSKDKKSNSRGTQKRIDELTDLLLHCGEYDKENTSQSTSLIEFAKMFIGDSLIMDQGTFEVVENRKGKPSYFSIVDASTVRLLDPGFRDPGDPFAVQVINGSIVADFKQNELAFCIRNPRSGIRSKGYGLAEIETLVTQITGLLWGQAYNMKFFSQGSAARGVLNFKGSIPDKHLKAFRRQWYAMMSGVANAWRTPITNAEELQWINMQLTNRDMEYSAWMDFLIKLCCARFNIAPEEIQFAYGNTGQSSAMGQSPIEDKIKASRDLGLRPLVLWFFTQLNQHYLSRIAPDFEIVPTGLDGMSEDEEVDLLQKKTATFLTIDEARIQAGEDPIGEENGGHVIENSVWIQWYNAKQMAAQQQGAMDQAQAGQPQGDQDGDPNDTGGLDVEPQISMDDDEDRQGGQDGSSPVDGEDGSALGKSRDRIDRVRYTIEV